MFELIFTVCINMSTCTNRPIDKPMPLDECLRLSKEIDAKEGSLNCAPAGTVQRFRYLTEIELKEKNLASVD